MLESLAPEGPLHVACCCLIPSPCWSPSWPAVPAQLSRREAENDIRKDYPVQLVATVPESASAIKGSPEHAKLVALQEVLARPG